MAVNPLNPEDDHDDDDRDEETPQEAAVRLLQKWTAVRDSSERLYRKRVGVRARYLSPTDRDALRHFIIHGHELLLEALERHDGDTPQFSFPSESQW